MSLSINPTNDGWFFTMLVVHGMNPFVVLEFDQRLRDDDKTRAVCEQVNRLTLTSSPSRRVSSNSMLGLNSYDDDLSVDSLLNDHLPSCSLMINFGLINFADWRRRRLTPYRIRTPSQDHLYQLVQRTISFMKSSKCSPSTYSHVPLSFSIALVAAIGQVKRDPSKSTVKIKVDTEYLHYLLNRRRTRRVKWKKEAKHSPFYIARETMDERRKERMEYRLRPP